MTAPAVDAPEERSSTPSATLADRLNGLFDKLRDQGVRVSNEDVADAITAAGTNISASYLWLLRTGKRDNPGHHHIAALATYFHVPVTYFFDDALAGTSEEDLAVLTAVRHEGVRRLATHAAGLPPDVLDALLVIVEQARKAQGLPVVSQDVATS